MAAEPEVLADEHPLMRQGMGRLRGKVAVITGANSGIGRATARLFGREGAKVVCCDIQETITPRIDELIKKEGGQAVFTKIDVTKQEDCDRLLSAAIEVSAISIFSTTMPAPGSARSSMSTPTRSGISF